MVVSPLLPLLFLAPQKPVTVTVSVTASGLLYIQWSPFSRVTMQLSRNFAAKEERNKRE